MPHFTDADAKTIGEFFTFAALIITLFRGNRRITDVAQKVEQQSNFNGNKSLANGGSFAEALTRIEDNQKSINAERKTETNAIRETLVTISSRLGGVDNRLSGIDNRVDTLQSQMNRHIERTEKNA